MSIKTFFMEPPKNVRPSSALPSAIAQAAKTEVAAYRKSPVLGQAVRAANEFTRDSQWKRGAGLPASHRAAQAIGNAIGAAVDAAPGAARGMQTATGQARDAAVDTVRRVVQKMRQRQQEQGRGR